MNQPARKQRFLLPYIPDHITPRQSNFRGLRVRFLACNPDIEPTLKNKPSHAIHLAFQRITFLAHEANHIRHELPLTGVRLFDLDALCTSTLVAVFIAIGFNLDPIEQWIKCREGAAAHFAWHSSLEGSREYPFLTRGATIDGGSRLRLRS